MKTTAAELGRLIASGKLDPVELASETLDAINTHPERKRIYTVISDERAMAEAEDSRKRQKTGTLASPLDGVPISWKDLFDTAGIATEAGTPLLKGRIPQEDCLAIARATTAGLVCTGKTHTSELAFSGLGINPNAQTAPNIHGDSLAPGGSSSGAAASVANDLVPIGIGSDTGGSVRIPSAWNDLVGLKTTSGLIPNDGVIALCPGFDTAGPLCRSVEDAWLMTAILAGLEPVMPEAKPLSECRFLVNRTIVLDGLDEKTERGFKSAIEKLASAGVKIDYGDIDQYEEILPLGPVLFPYEAWQSWGKEITDNPGVVFEPVENRFLSGKHLTREEYQHAWEKMETLRKAYNERVAGYDAVLSPTVCITPPDKEKLLGDIDLFQKTNLLALRNTRFGNMFGLCALTIPTGEPSVGIMLGSTPFTEKNLVSVGISVENALQS